MKMHFVEVRVLEMVIWMAGIRNAVPVLGCLKGICKRLLVLAVQMLFLFWWFTTDLLEMLHFLMDFREPLIKGFPGFY